MVRVPVLCSLGSLGSLGSFEFFGQVPVHASFLHNSRALLAHVQHSRDVLQQRAVDADVLVAGAPAVGLVLGHGVEPAQTRREKVAAQAGR